MRPQLVLADDHVLLTEALAKLLEADCDVMAVAHTGRELLNVLDLLRPDLVIADVAMPDLNGLEALREIRSRWPGLSVIMLSMHTDVQYAHCALRAGARGYVRKNSGSAELRDAVFAVLSGRTYVAPDMAERLEDFRHSCDEDVLTTRQREVLQLIAEGRQAKEIAFAMRISAKTVEFHRAAISQRLGLRSTAELTKYALEHGISSYA